MCPSDELAFRSTPPGTSVGSVQPLTAPTASANAMSLTRSSFRFAVALCGICFSCHGTACGDESPSAGPPSETRPAPSNLAGRGLVDFVDVFPLSLFHMQLPIDTTEVIDRGDVKLSLDFSWGNSLAVQDTDAVFVVDAETYLLRLGAWYAVHDSVYLGVDLPYVFRGGGVLDPVVEGFHDVFGISNDERERRSTNSYDITIIDEQGRERELEQGSGLAPLVLKGHWNAYAGGEWAPAIVFEGYVGVPTASKGFGSNGVDVGLAASFHKRFFENWYVHVGTGWVHYTDKRSSGLRYQSFGVQGSIGLEWAVTPNLSLAFEAMTLPAQLEFPRPLSERRNYLGGGLKWEFAPDWELELSVIENLGPQRNSSDITLGAGISLEL